MKVRIKKLKELEDALNPNNIDVGFEKEFEFTQDQYFQPPTINERFYPNPHGSWSTSGVQEIIDHKTFKTYSSIYEWEVLTDEPQIMVMTDAHVRNIHYPGIDGQYFQLALNKEFKEHNVLKLKFQNNISEVIVTGEKVWYISETKNDGTKIEYWVHTVRLFGIDRTQFFPRKFLLPGTLFELVK